MDHTNCDKCTFCKITKFPKNVIFSILQKMSLFTKNCEKLDHLEIWLCHYDFFTISNVLTGAPKNAKICLYCIRHGKPLFLGNFLWFFTCVIKLILLLKTSIFIIYINAGFSKFSKNSIFVKMTKSDISRNFTFTENYDFSKNVISLDFVKHYFHKSNTF